MAALNEVAFIDRLTVSPTSIRSDDVYVGLENISSDGDIVGVGGVEAGLLKSNKFRFDERHILYGKLRPYLAKIAAPGFSGVCSTDILPIRPGPRVERSFLYHFLRTPEMVSQATALSAGANLPRLSPRLLAEFPVPLPPLAEQRRIAAALDAGDAVRMKRRQALAKLDTLTQSIFLDMFGEADKCGWPMVTLGDVAVLGPQNGIYKKASLYGAGVKILRIDSFQSGEVVDLATLKRVRLSPVEASTYALQEDDIVINRVNSRSHLGKSAIMPRAEENVVFESNMMRLRVDPKLILPKFAIEMLQTASIKRQILNSCKDAINQSSINQGDVKGFQFALPPLALQVRFAEAANSVGGLKAALMAQSQALETLFASLQHRAFRGEL